MNVTATIPIETQETTELAHILDCTKDELAAVLQQLASAALTEYTKMILGQRVFSRGSDMREYRLFLLIGTIFENNIPDEDQVSRLFQTTASESRTLLRSVLSKYQYQIGSAVNRSMTAAVKSAVQQEEGDPFEVTINSHAIVDALNRTLAEADGTLQPIKRVPNSIAVYEISPSSAEALKQQLKIADA